MTPASSSALGLMRSGAARSNPSTSAASGRSEVSIATLQAYGASLATTSAYQVSGMPGGNDPDITTQSACSAWLTTARVSASMAAPSMWAPGSLIFVVVPSLSVMAMFVRTDATIGTQRNGTPLDCNAVTIGSVPDAGSSATASTPARDRARATLTPFPPGSVVTELTRCTAPRVSGVASVTVRSRLGFGVTVTIMR